MQRTKFFLMLFINIQLLPVLMRAQVYLNDVEKIAMIPKGTLNQIPGLTPLYDVDVYRVLYNTVNTEGNPTLASGAFMVPVTIKSLTGICRHVCMC